MRTTLLVGKEAMQIQPLRRGSSITQPEPVIPTHAYCCPSCGDQMMNLERAKPPAFLMRSTCERCKATYRIDLREQVMEPVEYRSDWID